MLKAKSIDSENDSRTGCQKVSYFQQHSYSGPLYTYRLERSYSTYLRYDKLLIRIVLLLSNRARWVAPARPF